MNIPELTYQNLEDHMVKVEGGEFQMGSEDIEEEEKPVHSVKLKDFHLCRFPVTQSLWESVMGENPASFPHPCRPIETVSWYDAVSFCNALSEKRGLDPYYEIDPDRKDPNNKNEDDELRWWVRIHQGANGYRLPTEAEWEYAAKGGKYAQQAALLYAGSNSLTEVAWHDRNGEGNSLDISQPSGLKRPNALGLFDMSGNVDEWCGDWYDGNYYEECKAQGMVENPSGPEKGSRRVVRGGSWGSTLVLAYNFRPAYRYDLYAPYGRLHRLSVFVSPGTKFTLSLFLLFYPFSPGLPGDEIFFSSFPSAFSTHLRVCRFHLLFQLKRVNAQQNRNPIRVLSDRSSGFFQVGY